MRSAWEARSHEDLNAFASRVKRVHSHPNAFAPRVKQVCFILLLASDGYCMYGPPPESVRCYVLSSTCVWLGLPSVRPQLVLAGCTDPSHRDLSSKSLVLIIL